MIDWYIQRVATSCQNQPYAGFGRNIAIWEKSKILIPIFHDFKIKIWFSPYFKSAQIWPDLYVAQISGADLLRSSQIYLRYLDDREIFSSTLDFHWSVYSWSVHKCQSLRFRSSFCEGPITISIIGQSLANFFRYLTQILPDLPQFDQNFWSADIYRYG